MENTALNLPTLRPLGLGELLDRAIRLYRSNFLTFIGIIAVVYVPLTILQIGAMTLMNTVRYQGFSTADEILRSPAYWVSMLSTIVLGLVQFVLVQGIASGALARAVADNYLGRSTSMLDAYRGIGKSWLSLVGALLLLILLIIVIFIYWFIVPCLGWFTGLGMLFFVSSVINPLVPAVVVLEKQGSINSIQRAWNLARRRFWPIFGYTIVLALFSLLVVNGPTALANAILVPVLRSFSDPTTQTVVASLISGLVSLVSVLLYYPLQMTAFTLIYFDLRVRTEGFDIALLTMDAASSAADAENLPVPASQAHEPFMTWPEIGSFAILTIGGFALYTLLVSIIFGGTLLLASLFG